MFFKIALATFNSAASEIVQMLSHTTIKVIVHDPYGVSNAKTSHRHLIGYKTEWRSVDLTHYAIFMGKMPRKRRIIWNQVSLSKKYCRKSERKLYSFQVIAKREGQVHHFRTVEKCLLLKAANLTVAPSIV